jgi:choline dehydrogenase-like flavoprotein
LNIIKCDYLIIGSGAGGSSVANYLTDLGLSVLMLEEGKDFSGANQAVSATDSMNGMWRSTGLTPAFGAPSITYAEARCVGGGTEINSGILQRPPESVLNYWSNIDSKNKHFYKNELSKYYDWVEHNLSASIKDSSQDRHSQLLKEVAINQNWSFEALPRAIKNCVCKEPLCICGGKQSMTATLLKEAQTHEEFVIESHARATKLVLKNQLIKEVLAEKTNPDGKTSKFKVIPCHVFLCAGTIHSPHLLMKSGINFIGLGQFQLHPTLKLLAHFKEKVNAARQPLPNYAVTEFMPDIRFGGSVVSPGVLGMALAENWSCRSYLQDQLDNLASYYVMIRPNSWGKIRSTKFLKDPLVTYSLEDKDIQKIALGAANLAKALIDIGAITVHPSIKKHPGWSSKESVEKDILDKKFHKNLNLMSIHLFGSCSPRNNPEYLIGNGRIKGIDNLILADGSCIPSAPGVNPQASIMAFARHNAIKYCEMK